MKRLGPATARLMRLADRTLSALLMAASVTLLAAGLLWYGSPSATGADLALTGAAVASSEPLADPGVFPTPASTQTGSTAPPVGSASPRTSSPPATTPSASASASASQSAAAPTPSAVPSAPPGDPSEATRIVIPSLEIDLPVIRGDPDPTHYPKCDVAMYQPGYVQPGELGSTYIYAHARDGMFLPLLTSSLRNNGDGMLGSLVEVYTDDDLRYVYAISKVKRHATDYSLPDAVAAGVSQLVLQTSEGPKGTVPKLQILATLQDTLPADPAAAHPKAQPRDCENSP